MWLLAGIVFATCKFLSWLRLEKPSSLTGRRLLGYLLLWPGMRPQPFLAGPEPIHVYSQNLVATGCINLCSGLFLLGLAFVAKEPGWLPAWLTMAAFSFLVHFGAFDLLAAAWRKAGVPVEKLFVCPVAARSLADFWGQRWNRAFSVFARDLLFVPTARYLGVAGATLLVFGFSGLVHELVISVPAGGGYGGPLLYFLIQGLCIVVENRPAMRRRM
jgi:D-alanyl-lipoteichoic acid acyltransferase DltB (MBOAT superfamily)